MIIPISFTPQSSSLNIYFKITKFINAQDSGSYALWGLNLC